LSENGALELFGANSVQEVMAIFDTDGNGTLEPEELSLLLEFIEIEKAKMLAMSENKESVASGEGAAKQQRTGAINVLDEKRLQITKIEQHLSNADADGDGNVDLEEVHWYERAFFEFTTAFFPAINVFIVTVVVVGEPLIHALLQLCVFLQNTGTAGFFGASANAAADEVMKMFDSDGWGSTRMSLRYGQCYLMLPASCSNGYLDAEEFSILKDFIETEKQMLLATQQ